MKHYKTNGCSSNKIVVENNETLPPVEQQKKCKYLHQNLVKHLKKFEKIVFENAFNIEHNVLAICSYRHFEENKICLKNDSIYKS